MARRIGLFGGSFNPIHNGHLIVARAVAEQAALDHIYLLPSSFPPHKHPDTLIGPHHRAEMVKLAIEGEPLFRFSDFDLRRDGPSYTIETVAHFRTELGATTQLCWMIGADWLAYLPDWRQADTLIDTCEIITAVRPAWSGCDWEAMTKRVGPARVERLKAGLVQTPLVQISSTDIRDRVRSGRSVRFLVPDVVADYIREHGLYAAE